MLGRIVTWISVFLALLFVDSALAANPRLGFAVTVSGEGFFLNPVVTKILVTEVTKASLAEASGMGAGDIIMKIEGKSVVGKRARELRQWMELKPGETRTLRVQHADGTEFDARFTNPKE